MTPVIRFDMPNGSLSGKVTDRPIKAWHVDTVEDLVVIDFDRRLDRG